MTGEPFFYSNWGTNQPNDWWGTLSSAVRGDLDVWAHLKDILDHPPVGDTDHAVLHPDTWPREHPDAIRAYRVAEGRDRADRKQYRRAVRRRLRLRSLNTE